MAVEIRDFIPAYREEYIRMAEEFFSSDAVLHPIPRANFERTFAQCVEGSPYVRGLLLLSDGKAAGYSLLTLTWSNDVGGLCVWLEEVFVLPAFQGKGVGGALFDFIEREYVASGRAKRLRLEVAHANEGAIRLYERRGFEHLDYRQMVKDIN